MTVSELHILVNAATAWPLQQVFVKIEGDDKVYEIVRASGTEGNEGAFIMTLGAYPRGAHVPLGS